MASDEMNVSGGSTALEGLSGDMSEEHPLPMDGSNATVEQPGQSNEAGSSEAESLEAKLGNNTDGTLPNDECGAHQDVTLSNMVDSNANRCVDDMVFEVDGMDVSSPSEEQVNVKLNNNVTDLSVNKKKLDSTSSGNMMDPCTSDKPPELLAVGTSASKVTMRGAGCRESVSSAQSDVTPSIYHVKWIKFHGTSTPIVMQNQNGPCPMLAIVNVLLLQGKIKLTPNTELVQSDQLIASIADYIFENVPKHITEATRLNYEQNMHDAIAVFPRLQTGLDVNVKFTGISDFEYTSECIVFDLLDIPLVHGWLIDPGTPEVAEALGSYSYNQIVEKIIENKNSSKAELAASALIAEDFLNTTASQLTYHGLSELSATLNDEQLCILFRNNHFSTLYKHKTELFLLATDQGFLNESNVVWETLSNVEGDCHFVDANFHTFRLESANNNLLANQPGTFTGSLLNSKEQIDHDYLVALSLEQEQSPSGATGSDVWLDSDINGLSDHDLAVKLQREEELKAAGAAAATAAGASSSSHSTNSSHSLSRLPKSVPVTSSQTSTDGGAGSRDKKSDCQIL